MNEQFYFLAPLNSLLWALGGTYHKAFRRIGYPVLVAILLFVAQTPLLQAIGAIILAHLSTRLPFTLIGKSIHESLVNWFWVPIWALFLLVPALVIGLSFQKLYFILWATPVITTMCYFSNIDDLSDSFVWKAVEVMVGLLVFIPYLIC